VSRISIKNLRLLSFISLFLRTASKLGIYWLETLRELKRPLLGRLASELDHAHLDIIRRSGICELQRKRVLLVEDKLI